MDYMDGTFRAALAERRPNDAQAAKRFFTGDDQLIHANGKTYAVSTQWSKGTMEAVMAGLLAKFDRFEVSYTVSDPLSA
jgi:hypothetical protein